MCKVVKGLKVVSRYNEEIEVIEKLPNKRCMIKFLCNERVIETYNKSVKDGCALKHEFTLSYKGIGMLGYVNPKEFPHTQKEKSLWKHLMNKYASKGIECEEYCVFKNFVLKLRKVENYNKLINGNTRLIVNEDGSMKVQDVEFLKPVKRVHVRTGKTYYYDTLNDCADSIGMCPQQLKKYVHSGKPYRGYRIEFTES